VFTCVGWQVTSYSSEVGFPQEELYQPLSAFLLMWMTILGQGNKMSSEMGSVPDPTMIAHCAYVD